MKMNKEEYEMLAWGDTAYEIVDDTDWMDEGKFQSRIIVFKVENKFYSAEFGRYGDHWSGYEMELEEEYDLPEVFPVEVTTVVYKCAPKGELI